MLTFTFSVPSIVSDTAKARAKGWRDLEEIMREGVRWFADVEVKQLLQKITKRPKQGRPPEVGIQERLLDEYDAAVRDVAPKRLNKTEFARKFCKKYDQHSLQGVKKQLDRLLLESGGKQRLKRKWDKSKFSFVL